MRLQVTEDVYLARVYAAAMELFRVPNVSAAVDRKLAIIRETYTALHSEAAGSRAELAGDRDSGSDRSRNRALSLLPH